MTADENGNLATVESGDVDTFLSIVANASQELNNMDSAITANTAGIAANAREISDNRDGIAMAMALKAPYVAPDATYAVSGGMGFFDGAKAFAMSGAYRVDARTQVDAGVTYGFDSDKVGGRVGVSYSW